MKDESLYEQIAAELAAGQQKPGIWLKALTDANGNEAKAKVEYVKIRLADLKQQSRTELQPVASTESSFKDGLRWLIAFCLSVKSWYAKMLWAAVGLVAAGFLGMMLLSLFVHRVEDSGLLGLCGFLVMSGAALGTTTAVIWGVSRTQGGWRRFTCTLVGLVIGAALGFGLVFAAFLSNPGHHYGEMAGVAGLGWGTIAGAPLGGLLGAAGGLWVGTRQVRKQAILKSSSTG